MIERLRIGLGIDVHRLEAGHTCVLGGVRIDAPVGPVGHSDGDAILHAICDGILGAAGLDDLGTLFSDRDTANRNRDSSEFCTETLRRAEAAGYRVLSIDLVLEAERPKLIPHRSAMRTRIAELFAITPDRINLKGKTGERLGAIGRGEALRATAVVLLGPRED